ncbi:MAG: elongation factor P [Alphaproteobacteria bacterium]
MQVNANTLRKGHVIEHNGKLCVVIRSEITIPGKGNAIVQVDMKDIRTGVKTEMRYRTQETIERVQVNENDMQFLFAEGDMYTFMDQESFEQMTIPRDVIGDPAVYLQESMICSVKSFEGAALAVEIPGSVVLKIVEADPVVKGQTASSSYKPALLENGVRILVPPFIGVDTKIVVNTTDSTYVERAKE